ncbi:MAG TPA: class I SAM-dependent methyltransferase [Candidatus Limnocylindrales bacterium]|nr:class I SAM-dependent methyltransferase [Candidatus Limnocylindrales bacterium]
MAVSREDAHVEGYQLIDAGAGRRLERFGQHLVDRPYPAADSPRRSPDPWAEADLRFDRDGGWQGPGLETARRDWTVEVEGLSLELRPTDAGQTGIFAEHASLMPWLVEQVRDRAAPNVLNLFAYTGLVTLGLARAGAAVAHVDAARPSVEWARRNAALNGLDDHPIRWLIDDVPAFVAREVRRDRRYDGVVLDPPTYGHGASGKAWRIERDLPPLLDDIDRVLVDDGFLLLTAHTQAVDPFALGAFIGREVEVGELSIRAASGAVLHLGAFARLAPAS